MQVQDLPTHPFFMIKQVDPVGIDSDGDRRGVNFENHCAISAHQCRLCKYFNPEKEQLIFCKCSNEDPRIAGQLAFKWASCDLFERREESK